MKCIMSVSHGALHSSRNAKLFDERKNEPGAARHLKVVCSNSLPFSSLDNIPAVLASLFLKMGTSLLILFPVAAHSNVSPSDA